jgi:putative transcriptional regulator
VAWHSRAHGHFVERRIDPLFMAVPMKTRLRVLRAEKEWSQAELAAHVGVARGTINAIETGKYDPSLPLAFKIARVFGKTVEEVFLYQESELSAVTDVSL